MVTFIFRNPKWKGKFLLLHYNKMLRKMLRLIHVIIFPIIRLNEAERMTEKDLIACFNFTNSLNNERQRHFLSR